MLEAATTPRLQLPQPSTAEAKLLLVGGRTTKVLPPTSRSFAELRAQEKYVDWFFFLFPILFELDIGGSGVGVREGRLGCRETRE
jgi:hypothetical protein